MIRCECEKLFSIFTWANLSNLKYESLPSETGVYVIRYREKGSTLNETIQKSKQFFKQSNWKAFMKYAFNRIERIKRIGEFPYIYIGAAPSKDNFGFQSRYKDLTGLRHTVFYPLLALLIANWKLDYGWYITENARKFEKELKMNYKKIHKVMPALVVR